MTERICHNLVARDLVAGAVEREAAVKAAIEEERRKRRGTRKPSLTTRLKALARAGLTGDLKPDGTDDHPQAKRRCHTPFWPRGRQWRGRGQLLGQGAAMKVKPVNPFPYLRRKKYRDGRPRLVIEKPGFHAVTIADRGQYQAAMAALVPLERQGPALVKAGTLGALIRSYLASAAFAALAPATRGARRRVLEKLEQEHGAGPVKGLEAKHIRAMIEKLAGRAGKARNLLGALSALLAWAVDMGLLEVNVCRGVKRPKLSRDGWHAWTDAEIEQYRAYHALGTMARLALELAICTLQRRAELVVLGRQHVEEGNLLRVRQRKTGAWAYVEITPELQAAIDAMPPTNHLTYLRTSLGDNFTPNGFTHRMKLWAREAGLMGVPLHGLRKAGARIKIEKYGWDIPEVQAAGGWASLRDLEIYLKSSCRKKAARRGGEKIRRETARRTHPMQAADTGKKS